MFSDALGPGSGQPLRILYDTEWQNFKWQLRPSSCPFLPGHVLFLFICISIPSKGSTFQQEVRWDKGLLGIRHPFNLWLLGKNLTYTKVCWDHFCSFNSLTCFDCIFVFKMQSWAEYLLFFFFFWKKQAVFLNCKLESFQLAQRKSVLRVAPAPRFSVIVFVCRFFFKSFSAHHPAKKTAESLMIPQNTVLRGRKKGEPFKVRS